MEFKSIKKIISIASSAAIIASSVPFAASAADEQIKGIIDGYDYEMWNQNSQGTIDYVPGAGSFSCAWDDIENFIANTGKKYNGQRKNYKMYGNISFSYDLDFTPNGNAFYGAYGWTENPLVEWYIVDGWGSWRPGVSSNSQTLGTTIVNGHEYEVYRTNRYNQPSLSGPSTFCQYWSVRTDSDSENNVTNHIRGNIDVTKHFDSWNALGLDMTGTLYEVVFNVEGYRSHGSAELKRLRFGEGGDGTPLIVYDNKYSDNGTNLYKEKGCFFFYNFGSFIDEWEPRGDEYLSKSDRSYDDFHCMEVCFRSESWQGPSRKLSSVNLVPGENYSFGAFVMQNGEESADFELVLQYMNSNGRFQYDTIAEAKAVKEEWTELSNYSYTIPKDARQLTIFIDTPGYTGDFYVDSAYAGLEGITASSLNSNETNICNRGDINRDGVIDIFDLPLLRKAILMTDSYDYIPPVNSDINDDGSVDIADLICLKKYLLGSEKHLKSTVTTTAETTAVATTETTAAVVTTSEITETTEKTTSSIITETSNTATTAKTTSATETESTTTAATTTIITTDEK